MPTPAERRALLFLSLVGALGAGVRLSRASALGAPATGDPPRTLDAQRAAVDSAIAVDSLRALALGPGSRREVWDTPGQTAQQRAPRRARRSRRAARDSSGAVDARTGARMGPPPSTGSGISPRRFGTPVLPDDQRSGGMITALGAGTGRTGGLRAPGAPLVDVDRASAAEIERLPYIGPALARRIVANRDSFGPFGSTAALGKVRGVGPALIERLKDRVTFSAPARPPRAATPARRRPRR